MHCTAHGLRPPQCTARPCGTCCTASRHKASLLPCCLALVQFTLSWFISQRSCLTPPIVGLSLACKGYAGTKLCSIATLALLLNVQQLKTAYQCLLALFYLYRHELAALALHTIRLKPELAVLAFSSKQEREESTCQGNCLELELLMN